MSNKPIKVVTEEGLRILWNQISLDDYPNNDLLIAVLDGIDATKADKTEVADAKQEAIDALEIVATGKADKIHSHEIADVNGLQVKLDEIASTIIQPDWNQSYESEPDYIKNKTHGIEKSNDVLVGTFTFREDSNISPFSYSASIGTITMPTTNCPSYVTISADGYGKPVVVTLFQDYVNIEYIDGAIKDMAYFKLGVQANQTGEKTYSITLFSNHDLSSVQFNCYDFCLYHTLDIDFGGTGAADADTALTNLGATYTINAIADLTAAFNAMPLHSTRNVWILGTVFKTLTNNLDAGNQAHGYMTKLTDSVLELRVGGGGYHWTIRFDGSSATSQYRATDNIAYQTTDLTAGSSSLSTGHMMLVYS